MDDGSVTAKTGSAAFDTVDHSSITDLLSTWYGTYMSSHEQKVKLMDCLSSTVEVTWGSSSIRPVAIPQRTMHVELYCAKLHLHSKQYRFFKKEAFSTITMQPRENPARVLLGLHGDCTEGFLLNNLHCLECTGHTEILHHSPSKPFWIASVGFFLISALSSTNGIDSKQQAPPHA